MSSPLPPSVSPELLLLVFLVLILARRTYLMVQGSRFSVGRLVAFAGLYILLFAALAFSTLYSAVGTWGSDAYLLLVAYAALPVAAGFLAAPYVRRVVRFELRDDGQWYYRLSWHVPVLYLSLFLARIVAEVAVFGLAGLVVTFPPPAPPSVGALEVLVAVDLLLGLSLGLLVGRSIGVYLAHGDLTSREASPPGPPVPSG